jgi:hypothetical protein
VAAEVHLLNNDFQQYCGLMLKLWREEKARRQKCLRYWGGGVPIYTSFGSRRVSHKWIAG